MTAVMQRVERFDGARRLEGEQLAELVRGAAAGRRESWERLIDEFAGLVWVVARSYRLSDADAADVAQTTWLALLEHLDDLHDPARVGSWLATTARHASLRVLRGELRESPCGEELPDTPSAESADSCLMECERDRLLGRALARLRASDQALLRLLMTDPAPAYEEVSAALGLPIGSIGPTRARALERLRTELRRDGSLLLLVA